MAGSNAAGGASGLWHSGLSGRGACRWPGARAVSPPQAEWDHGRAGPQQLSTELVGKSVTKPWGRPGCIPFPAAPAGGLTPAGAAPLPCPAANRHGPARYGERAQRPHPVYERAAWLSRGVSPGLRAPRRHGPGRPQPGLRPTARRARCERGGCSARPRCRAS